MKTIFQVRFLLTTIGLLVLVLYIQYYAPGRLSASRSLGGPVEIARQAGDYANWLLLLLRILVSGLLIPSGIGLLVGAVLRWRHATYHISLAQVVILSVLVWWAWGLLNVFIYKAVGDTFDYGENQVFQWASVLTSIGWVIAAARFSYYQERTPKQLVEVNQGNNALSNSGFPARDPE